MLGSARNARLAVLDDPPHHVGSTLRSQLGIGMDVHSSSTLENCLVCILSFLGRARVNNLLKITPRFRGRLCCSLVRRGHAPGAVVVLAGLPLRRTLHLGAGEPAPGTAGELVRLD